MTPLEQLSSILDELYENEDGEEYKIELLPALSERDIDAVTRQCPTQRLPADIRALLKFTRGFEFNGMGEITFDGVGQFPFNDLFPFSVELAGDGFGNFWVLDLLPNGDWGPVYYVCHDPAVVVKHSENIAGFILHIHEFGKKGSESNLDIIHNQTVMDIWQKDNGFMTPEEAQESPDVTIKEFAASLPDNFVIADMRNKPIRAGFAWGKFSAESNVIRHETEPLWAVEKKEKKGFLSKLFG